MLLRKLCGSRVVWNRASAILVIHLRSRHNVGHEAEKCFSYLKRRKNLRDDCRDLPKNTFIKKNSRIRCTVAIQIKIAWKKDRLMICSIVILVYFLHPCWMLEAKVAFSASLYGATCRGGTAFRGKLYLHIFIVSIPQVTFVQKFQSFKLKFQFYTHDSRVAKYLCLRRKYPVFCADR